MPPFLKLTTSLPFISLLILHYGNLWGLYFLLTAAPKFMSEVSHSEKYSEKIVTTKLLASYICI